jgi:hypothetical protein
MDPEIQQLLDEGIASLSIGNKEEARRKLMQVINADERNEHAWLYLSEAVESDEDRQICLENVLTINPANNRAETELKALQEKMARGQVTEADLICPSCGVTNPPGSQRCLNCYADFEQAVPSQHPAPAEPSPGEVTVGEPPPREVQHKSFMEMLDTWAEMFTLPSQARLDEEQPYARWGLTIPGILLASGIAYFFVALTNVGATLLMPGGTLDPVKLLPIAYLLSLVYAPFILVFGIFSPLMLLGAVQPALGVIPALIFIPVAILALIMTIRALKSTHGYGTGAALGTLFLPGIVFFCFGALLSTLLAESLMTTIPFTLPEFQ